MKDFDKDLKEKVKINRVPEEVNKSIDETLKGLKDRNFKGKNKWVKNGMIAAGLLLSIGIGGTTATAVMNDVSFKEALTKIFDYNDVDEYILEVGETVSKKGINFTVTSSVSDGYRIIIGYEVTGDKFKLEELKEKVYTDSIKLDGKPLMGNIGSVYQEIKENKVVGIYEINIADIYFDGEAKTIGEFHGKEIEVGFRCAGMENTKWNLKVNVDASKMKREIKEYPLNIKTEWGEFNKIVITPLNIYLRGVNNKKLPYYPEYIVKNEKGEIAEVETSSIGAGVESEIGTGETVFVELKNNFKNIESLEILEVKGGYDKTKIEIKDGKVKKVEEGKLEIIKIENKDEFKITYKDNNEVSSMGIENLDTVNWKAHTKDNVSTLKNENTILKDGQYTLTYFITEKPEKLVAIRVKK